MKTFILDVAETSLATASSCEFELLPLPLTYELDLNESRRNETGISFDFI